MKLNFGQSVKEAVPEEVKGWNWGAFSFNGIWGIANKTYIALLAFIPIINIPVMIFLGYKGNELAWKRADWNSVEQFKSVQSKWNIAGIVAFLVYCVIVILALVDTL